MLDTEKVKLAVVGLGYVGLPLAVEFAKHFDTVGFDIDEERIRQLTSGVDRTGEVEVAELADVPLLRFTADAGALIERNVYVITVPTPVNEHKQPDFSPLIAASRTVGGVLKPGDTVIYESTVYPGATEEVCVPVLERCSGLRFNDDFAVGYSPERINPGDRERRLCDIPKVTSGSTPEAARFIDALYRSIIRAGTHLASSLRVAEASKVIENTQRDVNIALVNEFSMIFGRLGIDTSEVLAAAATKWNFLPFRPGLVGGHCIGVDPYYLIQKAESVGYFPDILLACRRVNDAMGKHVASEVIRLLIGKGAVVRGCRILILGFAFKENCPDLRNTRVVDLLVELKKFGVYVDIYDPLIDTAEARHEYGIDVMDEAPRAGTYDAVVLAVSHRSLVAEGSEFLRSFGKPSAVLYDVKGVLPLADVDGRL